MADDDTYDLMPHKQIDELKKQMQELRPKVDKSSSKEVINSMNSLTKSMDAMLRLFNEAAKELKTEEKESPINKKLDEIIDQNKTIAEGMVAISDMVKDFIEKQKKPEPWRDLPRQSFQRAVPDFQQPQKFGPQFAPKPQPMQAPAPSTDLPDLDELPELNQQGPVAMPSIPFTDLEMPPKPKKGGLFGRFKK